MTTREKCYTCFRPKQHCLCCSLKPIETKTKFVILIHPKEFKRERVGTGRLTHLQLENSELISGVNFSNNDSVNKFLNDDRYRCFLLYPSAKSININKAAQRFTHTSDKVHIIFILDATWSQAKNMLKQNEKLQSIEHLSFNSAKRSIYTFKQQPYPECVSTIESVKYILDSLTENGIEDTCTENFLEPFKNLIYKQLKAQQINQENSKILSSTKVTYKDNYKKGGIRKVSFGKY